MSVLTGSHPIMCLVCESLIRRRITNWLPGRRRITNSVPLRARHWHAAVCSRLNEHIDGISAAASNELRQMRCFSQLCRPTANEGPTDCRRHSRRMIGKMQIRATATYMNSIHRTQVQALLTPPNGCETTADGIWQLTVCVEHGGCMSFRGWRWTDVNLWAAVDGCVGRQVGRANAICGHWRKVYEISL